MKFEKKEVLSRKDAAARLSEIAEALGSGGDFELQGGGEKLKLDVADEVTFELEVELEGETTELEMEIKWSTSTPRVAAGTPRSTAQRGRSTARRGPSRSGTTGGRRRR
jgi:amphi-Trp domain-containing protein